MPPMDLPWAVFGRPIKPVALVLMNTMFILGWIGISDQGHLGDSEWADVNGVLAWSVGFLFIYSFYRVWQRGAEYALIGAFFVWGIRFWSLFLIDGFEALSHESIWLSACWILLAGGSWILERSDPYVHVHRPKTNRGKGARWNRR